MRLGDEMIDDMCIELSWGTSSLAEEFGEPDDVIYPYYGSIFGVDDEDARTEIGKFRAQYLDIDRAVKEGEAIFDALDCHSSSTAEYFDALFGNNAPDFSNAVEIISEGAIDGFNLLILDRVEILPEFRGKLAGLKVLRHMMVRFSAGAGLIALKAFPLQFECEPSAESEKAWRTKLDLTGFEHDEELSKDKLQSYYERLGFKKLPGSAFMIFPTGWQIPSLDEYQ
jgi:hypothetical protein